MADRHVIMDRVSGLGLMVGFECVKNKATKAPFPQSTNVSKMIGQAALTHGLVIFPCSGCLDGVEGHMIMLGPPLIITEGQTTELLEKLEKAITDVERQLGLSA
jgi:adenosylmethionine-8-amino-7-oxononanoate aminotransferase